MKRVFVLNAAWFDDYRDEITQLEHRLVALELLDAQERAEDLMRVALEADAGIRLAGYELDWLIHQAIKEQPGVVALLSQVHLDADDAAKLGGWLDSLSDDEVPDQLTPSIHDLSEALSGEGEQEVLMLEEESEFQFRFGRKADK